MRHHRALVATLAVALCAALPAIGGLAPAPAAAGIGSPGQSSCESGGSMTPTWDQTTVANRPRITALSVGGESISPSRAEAPLDGEIGVTVCPQDGTAKNTGVAFVRRTGSGVSYDIVGAQTPGSITVTRSTPITFTLALNDLSPRYTFSTVFAEVDAWSTTGLGTASATLTATVRAGDIAFVDGNLPAEQGCTRQPPECDAPQSDADWVGAQLQLKSEADNPGFAALAGGYFALRAAVGGFVQSSNGTLDVTLGGPHFKADGSTLNVGSMTAFLPDAALQQWFGVTATDVTADTFAVTRTEGATTSAAPWTSRVVPGGLAVDVPGITFSSPRYRIAAAGPRATASPLVTTWPAPHFFSAAKRARKVVATFAAAPGAHYQVVVTNLRRTYVVDVAPRSGRWTARQVVRTVGRGTWMVVARLKVGSGFGAPAVAVVRI